MKKILAIILLGISVVSCNSIVNEYNMNSQTESKLRELYCFAEYKYNDAQSGKSTFAVMYANSTPGVVLDMEMAQLNSEFDSDMDNYSDISGLLKSIGITYCESGEIKLSKEQESSRVLFLKSYNEYKIRLKSGTVQNTDIDKLRGLENRIQ